MADKQSNTRYFDIRRILKILYQILVLILLVEGFGCWRGHFTTARKKSWTIK